jgi:hypothetical protein
VMELGRIVLLSESEEGWDEAGRENGFARLDDTHRTTTLKIVLDLNHIM